MTDWRAIARAHDIPEPDVDRVVAPLESLEQVFRPLAESLRSEMEPATIYRPEGVEE